MDIKDKVIAITGAGRGLGRAIALQIAEKKGHLALLDLDAEGLAETVKLCEGFGVKAIPYVVNVTDEDRVVETFGKIIKDHGALHGLVNNAGILRDGFLVKVKDGKVVKKMSVDDFELVVDVHMKGSFLCGREAAVQMIETQVEEGVIINMASCSYKGNLGQTNYSAAKAGLVAMTTVWAKELARYGIRSMAIAPGVIETDMLKSMPPEVLAKMASHVPLGLVGQPEHIAKTAVFILENDYLSGRVIEVDGGFRL